MGPAGQLTQWVKALAVMLDNVTSILGPMRWKKERTNSHKLSSAFHTCAVTRACAHAHTQINVTIKGKALYT